MKTRNKTRVALESEPNLSSASLLIFLLLAETSHGSIVFDMLVIEDSLFWLYSKQSNVTHRPTLTPIG